MCGTRCRACAVACIPAPRGRCRPLTRCHLCPVCVWGARYVTNSFSGQHKPTVGVDFHFRRIDEDGTRVALQLWDIAGQDRFGAIYRVRHA